MFACGALPQFPTYLEPLAGASWLRLGQEQPQHPEALEMPQAVRMLFPVMACVVACRLFWPVTTAGERGDRAVQGYGVTSQEEAVLGHPHSGQ